MKCKSYTCPLNKLACPLNKLGRMTGAFTWPSCTTFATNVNWTCHYKSTRATIATRTGCVRRGIGHKTRKIHHPTYSSWTPRAHWKQDLVIEQLAYKNEAFIIVLQETYCREASDSQLLSSWVNPEQESRPCHVCPRAVGMVTGRSVSRTIRETEWLCVDVADYKIINIYKHPRSRLTPTTIPTFPHPSLYVGDFNC